MKSTNKTSSIKRIASEKDNDDRRVLDSGYCRLGGVDANRTLSVADTK